MGSMSEKVVVISGAARGQGRAHAVEMAKAGASIVAFDACAPFEGTTYPQATEADLQETVRLVEQEGQQCLSAVVDARNSAALKTLAFDAVEKFGRIDTLIVNHGIWIAGTRSWELDEADWQESVDVILTGSWKVTKAFIPKMIDGGRGGSIIVIGSENALKPQPSGISYSASKHGLIGLMRTLSWELGSESIRVNAIIPGPIHTTMTQEGDTIDRIGELWPSWLGTDRNLVPIDTESGWMPPTVISAAALFLASDSAKYITGTILPVDAGRVNY